MLRDKFLALFGKQLMAKKKLDNLSFEESLASLEAIVEQLEHGDLPLEQSMELPTKTAASRAKTSNFINRARSASVS